MATRSHLRSRAQSRRLSQRADSATLGTHHVPRGNHARPDADSSSASSSAQRSRRRQSAHIVEAVSPATTSAESIGDYSRRVHAGDYVEQARRQTKRRRRVLVIVLIAVVAIIGVGVGAFTYFSTMDARLAVDDSNMDTVLVQADEGPRFALCAAALGTADNIDDPSGDAYMLVRVDADAKQLTFIDIPSSVVVTAQDGKALPLYELRQRDGFGALVKAVSEFAAVDINEFVATDAAGIVAMTDAAGGVGFDVTEMIDDPRASTIVLDAGEATLTGDEALLVLRAYNFQKPFEQRARNRTSFTLQLLNQLMTLRGNAQMISDVAPSITSSASTSELLATAESLGALAEATVYSAVVPGRQSDDGRYGVSSGSWTAMMDAVREGRAPADSKVVESSVDPASVSIEVRNGGGITGAAAAVGDILTGQGYKVTYVGNMEDGAVYDETFVVYRDSAFEGAAQLVQSQIGSGRVINGGDFYDFGTKLLVVVGKDYVIPS